MGVDAFIVVVEPGRRSIETAQAVAKICLILVQVLFKRLKR